MIEASVICMYTNGAAGAEGTNFLKGGWYEQYGLYRDLADPYWQILHAGELGRAAIDVHTWLRRG
jgi:hypothetical protein